MGCASSRLGSTVSHAPETATIPHRIRRRLDSIRRRRRVADSFINAKETPSLSKKLLLGTADSDNLGSSPSSSRDLDLEKMSSASSGEDVESVRAAAANNPRSMPLERDRADCIGEAVKRAIDDVMLEEEEGGDDGEDEDDAGRRVVARGEKDDIDGDDDGDCIGFGSPSFRVYCAGPKPFGSFASIDYEVKSEDIPKANHESKESFESQPTSIPDKEGSTSSSKSKEIGGTKKMSSCRKKGPLGMKMLLHMSCYSCAAHDRNRIVHN